MFSERCLPLVFRVLHVTCDLEYLVYENLIPDPSYCKEPLQNLTVAVHLRYFPYLVVRHFYLIGSLRNRFQKDSSSRCLMINWISLHLFCSRKNRLVFLFLELRASVQARQCVSKSSPWLEMELVDEDKNVQINFL